MNKTDKIPASVKHKTGKSLSRVQLFGTPWTIAHQAPLSMGFSRQEYWSGLPLPSLTKCGLRIVFGRNV